VAGPVLGLTTAALAAGCASAPAGGPAAGAALARDAAPAVTAAQARQVFDAYAATTAAAARTGDGKLALSAVAGVQRAVLAAALSRHPVTISGTPSSGAYHSTLTITPSYQPDSYRATAFYRPEAAGYPRFFVAAATKTAGAARTTGTATPGLPAPVLIGGSRVPADGPALLLFEQASAGAPWLLGSVSQLPAGAALPKLATDSAGYVPLVQPAAGGLLAQLNSVGPLQAAVVDDGPSSAAAAAVAAGPLTTGLYASARDHADGLRAPRGDLYQWQLDGSRLPEFGLRTAAGGALVFYGMTLSITVAVPGYVSEADPVLSGPPIPVPDSLLPLLPQGQQAPLVQLTSVQALSFAAVDPPPAGGKVQVIAIGGGLTAATAT
jgi:hypothetical protein